MVTAFTPPFPLRSLSLSKVPSAIGTYGNRSSVAVRSCASVTTTTTTAPSPLQTAAALSDNPNNLHITRDSASSALLKPVFTISTLQQERTKRHAIWLRKLTISPPKSITPPPLTPPTDPTISEPTPPSVTTAPHVQPLEEPSAHTEQDGAESTTVLPEFELNAVSTSEDDVIETQSALCAKLTKLAAVRSRNAMLQQRASGLQYATHGELVSDVLELGGDPLESDGGRVVVFRGNPEARLVVIGEGPGAEEDRLGLPFVGAAGQLLDRVLRYSGFDVEKDVYVTNVVKRRPRNNRDPTAAEIKFYKPILMEELRLLKPSIVILAGRFALKAVLPDVTSLTRARGKFFPLIGGGLAIPVFHPAYLLRNPSAKSYMREDALTIRNKFLELHPDAVLSDVANQGTG